MSRKKRKRPKLRPQLASGTGPDAHGETVRARQPGRLLAILILGVVLAVLAVHWPALSAEALSFDDTQYLTKNPLVQNPGWSSTRRFLSEVLEPSTVGGYYQPLSMISLMLDHAWGGRTDNLMPFHRTSLALHVLNTTLVILFLYALFGNAWAAALAGLLFGVHPLTVESIAWVGERKTVLATFFALSCLIVYVRNARRPGARWYATGLILYTLALMSKPTTTPLPALLLILDYWPLRRLGKRAVVEKVPYFVIGAVAAIVTVISQARTQAIATPDQYPRSMIPLVVCHNIVFYLYKILWPVNLTSHYPFPSPLSLSNPMVLWGVIGTCILAVVLLLSLKWSRAPAVGWLFFFVAIFPTIGVIGFTTVIASDKYAYFPSVGLLITLAYLLSRLYAAPARITGVTPKKVAVAALVAVLVIAACEARVARTQLAVWRTTESLYAHMISHAPRTAMLHWGLGYYLTAQGRFEESVEHFHDALEVDPDSDQAHNNLGAVLMRLGKLEEAIVHLQTAVRLNPNSHRAYINLGATLATTGRLDEAADSFRTAVRLEPDSTEAYMGVGKVLAQQSDFERAIDQFEQVLLINPRDAEAHFAIGFTRQMQGRADLAIERYRRALLLDPNHKNARMRLNDALSRDD